MTGNHYIVYGTYLVHALNIYLILAQSPKSCRTVRPLASTESFCRCTVTMYPCIYLAPTQRARKLWTRSERFIPLRFLLKTNRARFQSIMIVNERDNFRALQGHLSPSTTFAEDLPPRFLSFCRETAIRFPKNVACVNQARLVEYVSQVKRARERRDRLCTYRDGTNFQHSCARLHCRAVRKKMSHNVIGTGEGARRKKKSYYVELRFLF